MNGRRAREQRRHARRCPPTRHPVRLDGPVGSLVGSTFTTAQRASRSAAATAHPIGPPSVGTQCSAASTVDCCPDSRSGEGRS
jgi:hypothetical protein